MAGLVLELQRDALDKAVSPSDLLRKALLISRKLNQPDIRNWIELELSGYAGVRVEEVERYAPYRVVKGELVCFNPYRGWIPLDSNSAHHNEAMRTRTIGQSISQLEDVLVSGDDNLVVKFSDKARFAIMAAMNEPFEPAVSLQRQCILGIIDSVRNKLLEWTLQLEDKGIIGQDLTFSRDEKIAASSITNNTINNIGTMSNSQLQVHSSGSQNLVGQDGVELAKKLVDALESVSGVLKLSASSEAELRAEIETIKTQLNSPKPKSNVLKECFLSAKAILEGAAGNVLASGIATQIPAVVAALGG